MSQYARPCVLSAGWLLAAALVMAAAPPTLQWPVLSTARGDDGTWPNAQADPQSAGDAPPAWLSGEADLPPARRTIRVSDAAQLGQALAEAQPGDEIVLREGQWHGVVLQARLPAPLDGDRCAPVVVRGDRRGRTVLTGPHWSLDLSGEFLVVADLVFELPADALLRLGPSSRGLRVTNCAFVFEDARHPVELSGAWIRFDHNYLTGSARGALVQVAAAGGRVDANFVASATSPVAIHLLGPDQSPLPRGCTGSRPDVRELPCAADPASGAGLLVVEDNLFFHALQGGPAELAAIITQRGGCLLRSNTVLPAAGTTPAQDGDLPELTRHSDVGPRWLPPSWRVGRPLRAEYTFDRTPQDTPGVLANTAHRTLPLVAERPAGIVGNAAAAAEPAAGAATADQHGRRTAVAAVASEPPAIAPTALRWPHAGLAPLGWGVSGGPDDRALRLERPLVQRVGAALHPPRYVTSFTLQGWLRVDEGTLLDRALLAQQRDHSGSGWSLSWEAGRLVLRVFHGPQHYVATSLDDYALDSQWRFFAVTWDARYETDNVRFYLGTGYDPVELAGAATVGLPHIDVSGGALHLPGGSPVWIDNVRWYSQGGTRIGAASAPQTTASAALTTTELDELRRGDLQQHR